MYTVIDIELQKKKNPELLSLGRKVICVFELCVSIYSFFNCLHTKLLLVTQFLKADTLLSFKEAEHKACWERANWQTWDILLIYCESTGDLFTQIYQCKATRSGGEHITILTTLEHFVKMKYSLPVHGYAPLACFRLVWKHITSLFEIWLCS